MAVLVHHHPVAAEVVALGRGELVACTTLNYLTLTGEVSSRRMSFTRKEEAHQHEIGGVLNKPAPAPHQSRTIKFVFPPAGSGNYSESVK